MLRLTCLVSALVAASGCGGPSSTTHAAAPAPSPTAEPVAAAPAPAPTAPDEPETSVPVGQYLASDTATEKRIFEILPAAAHCASYGSRGYTIACDGRAADTARHLLAQAVAREGLRVTVYEANGMPPAPTQPTQPAPTAP
jgi:hypothetical protein